MKRTSLYPKHRELGAKMVSFGGFEMPLRYSGIVDEHLTVRKDVGIFDLSHMGEFEISGSGAETFLQRMTVNDVSDISPGQAQYTAICFEDGGIVDDCVLCHLDDGYLLVVNATNIEKDLDWLKNSIPDDLKLTNVSDETSLIAVQGPKSKKLLQIVMDDPGSLDTLVFYHHTNVFIGGIQVLCSRTGYTGELGYELYMKGGGAGQLWDRILVSGSQFGIKPIGLGARDTLRLEMKYCLYGNDIDETTNPLEAGLGWITKLDRKEFIGREAIQRAKTEGLSRKLVGFKIKERGIPRNGYTVFANGERVGTVTSGSFSPSLGIGIGIGYVDVNYAKIGTGIDVDIRGRVIPAQIVKTPFWKNGTL